MRATLPVRVFSDRAAKYAVYATLVQPPRLEAGELQVDG